MSLEHLLKSSHTKTLRTKESARAYIRVSHERSAEKNISPVEQRNTILEYAELNGYEIVEIYQEEGGASAFRSTSARPQFERMVADSKADPNTTVILVAYFDRFSRSLAASAVEEDLLRHGVRIESATEGYYDPETEEGVIMGGLKWSLSHLFSLKIRKRVIPCMKLNATERDPDTGWAYKNGGWAQWGYRKHYVELGKNKKSMPIRKVVWVLDETEVAGKPVYEWARTVLIEWRLAAKCGYDTIAARLTEAGVPTPSGRSAWSTSTIAALISEWPRLFQYTGYGFWNKEDCTDKHNRRMRDPSEWVVVENAHPAIISEDEAEGIYAMVKDRKRATSAGRGKASRWALSGGLLKCAACGANYAGTTKHGNDYYVCGSYLYRRGADCQAPSWYIPRESIESLLIGKINTALDKDADAMSAWVVEVNEEIDAEWQEFRQAASERASEIRRLEKIMSNLIDTAASAGPTPDITRRIKETGAILENLRALEDATKPKPVTAASLNRLRDLVNDADPQARAVLLRELVVELAADGEAKALKGRLLDPRALVAREYTVPRGVVDPRHIEIHVTPAGGRYHRGWVAA